MIGEHFVLHCELRSRNRQSRLICYGEISSRTRSFVSMLKRPVINAPSQAITPNARNTAPSLYVSIVNPMKSGAAMEATRSQALATLVAKALIRVG